MEYKGEIFEPGKLYKFKHNGPSGWVVGKLECVDPDGKFRCKIAYKVTESFDIIVELSANELGNIVQKPVELISGRGYAFDYQGRRHTGFYCKADDTLYCVSGVYYVNKCSNLVELVEKNHE